MSEEKLTISELRKTISKQMSLPEETASRFLAALFPTIIEGLHQDGQVRIGGLGTFRIVHIAPRKSVNVNTGESIMLDGYDKVTFLPESYIREQINEPFSDLEPIRVDMDGKPLDPQSKLPGIDPRARFDEQADEIKSILAELGEKTPTTAEGDLYPETTSLDATIEHDSPVQEDSPRQETTQVQETTKSTQTPEEQPSQPSQTPEEQPSQPSQTTETPDGSSGFHGWRVALVTILILLAMLVAGYFVLVNKLESWANSLGFHAEEEEFLDLEAESEMLAPEPLLPFDSAVTEHTDSAAIQSGDSITAEVEDTTFQPTILGIETVQEGSRLAQIARRYYGDPDKWTVIYEANKNVIKDPNNLKAGTKLQIPRLP